MCLFRSFCQLCAVLPALIEQPQKAFHSLTCFSVPLLLRGRYYIGIKTPFRDHQWKIDIWFLHTDLPARSQLIQSVERVSETEKFAILRFKQLVLEKGLDIGSVLIYEAVLQRHITNEQTFLAFLAQR